MAAEAVGVPSASILGGEIVIIPGVAVEEEIVGPPDMVDSDGLDVVERELFKNIVTPVAFN